MAVRVSGDPVAANNGLFYIYSDHLGSTSVLSTASGSEVANSTTRYLPFGGYRGTPPTQTITDRDFTGQKENRELGLLYYNARFYAPNLGRFISADTIVPNPANPQSYNRFSYVRNNPLIFIDPSGHQEVPPPNPFDFIAELLGLPDTDNTPFEGLSEHAAALYVEAADTFNHVVGPWIEAGLGIIAPGYDAIGVVTGESPFTGTQYSDGERVVAGALLFAGVTPLDEVGEVAFGFSKNLPSFKRLFPQAKNYVDLGLNPYSDDFAEGLLGAMKGADTIRFDVSGMSHLNTADGVLSGPANLNPIGSTNWELRTIWDNPVLLDKTKFYRNGIEITIDELLKLE